MKERHTQAGWNIFSLIVFQAMPTENVLPPHSKSAHSQVFAPLFTSESVVCAGTICTDDTQSFRRQYYLSQNPLVRQSPGLPGLLHRPCKESCLNVARNSIVSNCQVIALGQ